MAQVPRLSVICGLKLPCTFWLQRGNFWILIFLDKNKLPSKFLQTKKELSKKSEYLRLLLVLVLALRGFSLGSLSFPSPEKPTFLNTNSIWKVSAISVLL